MPPPKHAGIAPDKYREVRAAVAKEEWAKGRDVKINPRTNSISIFNRPIGLGDDDATQIVRLPVPLYYHGLPVIAHSYPVASDPFIPPSFAVSSDAEPPGLPSIKQIKEINKFLQCRVHVVDVYLDDEITFGIDDEEHPNTFRRLEGNTRFEAYGYHCRIVPMSKITTPPSEFEEDEETEEEEDVVDPLDIKPGTSVRNDALQWSKVGVLLARQGTLEASPMFVYDFTVSNHSFIRKISLTWPLTLSKILMYLAILGFVYRPAKFGIVPEFIHIRFLTVRSLLGLGRAFALLRGWRKREAWSEVNPLPPSEHLPSYFCSNEISFRRSIATPPRF
jgi:hypothetical protein